MTLEKPDPDVSSEKGFPPSISLELQSGNGSAIAGLHHPPVLVEFEYSIHPSRRKTVSSHSQQNPLAKQRVVVTCRQS
jgi:hypothetical protein